MNEKELVGKLINSAVFHGRPYQRDAVATFEGDVVDIVKKLHALAESKGLRVERYQANGRGHLTCITWAVYKGDTRPAFTKDLPEDAHVVVLSCAEGTSKACQAYKKLSQLCEVLNV